MANAKDPTFLTRDLADDVFALVKSWKRGSLGGPPLKRRRGGGPRPPVRGILLAPLQDDGQADCAVTVYDGTSFIQKIDLLGSPTGGTFTLTFQGQTTVPLNWNCSNSDMQAALSKLETIGANNVTVDLGQQAYRNDGTDAAMTEFPGVWLVTFQGKFTSAVGNGGANPSAPPLLIATSSVTGISALEVETTRWAYSGHVETVNAVIPVGSPTPMVAGAVVLCHFMPGLGYGVGSCECREFS